MPDKETALMSPLQADSAVAFSDQVKKLEAFRHGQADPSVLDEFDAETEQLILRTFGDTTNHLEAYELATMGEAETIVNMPQAAQEDAVQDLPLKALEQRRQVLEACLAELDASSRRRNTQKPSLAPPAKPAVKKKVRVSTKKARSAKKTRRTPKKKAAATKRKKPATARRKPVSAKKKKAKRK